MKRKLLLVFVIAQIMLLSIFFFIPSQAYGNGTTSIDMQIFADLFDEPQNFLLFAENLSGSSYTFSIAGTATYFETGVIVGNNWTKIVTLNLPYGSYTASFSSSGNPDAISNNFTVGERQINLDVKPGTSCRDTDFTFEAKWEWIGGGYDFYIDKIVLNPYSITRIFENNGIEGSYPWNHNESYRLDSGLYVAYVVTDIIGYRDYELFNVSGCGTEIEPVWVRTMPMTCYRVWINGDNKFQLSFIYPYRDNNWVKIYDMSGKEVFSIDMPYDNPNIIVDLPNGMYTVKTFNDQPEPIQTFIIGK